MMLLADRRDPDNEAGLCETRLAPAVLILWGTS